MNSEEDRLVEHYLKELKASFPEMRVEKIGCNYMLTFPSISRAKAAETWLDENT